MTARESMNWIQQLRDAAEGGYGFHIGPNQAKEMVAELDSMRGLCMRCWTGRTTFQVRNGPVSMPCDHCGLSVSDHRCPPAALNQNLARLRERFDGQNPFTRSHIEALFNEATALSKDLATAQGQLDAAEQHVKILQQQRDAQAPPSSNLVTRLRDLSNRLRDSGRYTADECDLAAASLIDEAIAALPAETEASLPPQFVVCGTCQRKATATSHAEVRLVGIVCERGDCPGRPAVQASDEPLHWAAMRSICTCPKPGTSNSTVDPLCPLRLPHPWHAEKTNGDPHDDLPVEQNP